MNPAIYISPPEHDQAACPGIICARRHDPAKQISIMVFSWGRAVMIILTIMSPELSQFNDNRIKRTNNTLLVVQFPCIIVEIVDMLKILRVQAFHIQTKKDKKIILSG